MSAGVHITGIKELDKVFADMNLGMQKKALRPATREVAKMVLAQAKAEVPEDTVHRNAPATIPPPPVMLNCEGAALLLITEGSAVVAVPKVTALREPE